MWIDAICINQSDDKEKEQQVDRMDEIYKAAGNVVAWLGIPEDWEENLLKDVAKLLVDFTTSPRHPVLDEARMLAQICDNGYWGRTWVIQEVVLADTISILFGTAVLDFEALTDGGKLKTYSSRLVTKSCIEGMLASRAFRLRNLRNELRSGNRQHLEMPLLVAWIEHGAQSQCSVRTDEIFAVRSFAKKCCGDATPVQYKTNGRDLFLTLTGHHFAEHRFEGEEWLLISTEVEFHAQLLRRYPVEDAATILPVQLNDWVAMAKSHRRDPKFAIAVS